MAQACSRCGRINPVEAMYCHYDGIGLHTTMEKVQSPGRLEPPFYFPDGRQSKSFDELALACQGDWKTAKALLKSGDFSIYFRRVCRLDLANLGERCRKNPNTDLALDEFLSGLPTSVLEEPELHVPNHRVTLGKLQPGTNRDLYIQLENRGHGLLKGKARVVSQEFWLVLGDGKGAAQKHFHFWDQTKIHLQVAGAKLRSSDKPLTGKILVESNGGNIEIEVTAEVPVVPFPHGVLAGATTPRMVAKKARANPKEAAILFEQGEIQKWYQANGWTYPVPGLSASGVAAVQQFFEALGLTEAPKVAINTQSLQCAGFPGEKRLLNIHVSTLEKKYVFAHASSNAPWLKCRPVEQQGSNATIPLEVEIPRSKDPFVEGTVRVISNGGAKFTVKIRVAISAPPSGIFPSSGFSQPAPSASKENSPAPISSFSRVSSLPPIPGKPRDILEEIEIELDEKPKPYLLMAVGLAMLLAFGVLVAGVRDILAFKGLSSQVENAVTAVEFPVEDPKDIEPRLEMRFFNQPVFLPGKKSGSGPLSFGLFGNLATAFGMQTKKLFYGDEGNTNNSIIRVDGQDWYFGRQEFPNKKVPNRQGYWKGEMTSLPSSIRPFYGEGNFSVWEMPMSNLEISQTLRIAPGQQSGLLDTCLVMYKITNTGKRPREVGFRTLLDTFIGSNDGVPFLIPGETELCTTSKDMVGDKIPDFLQACETTNLKSPGTIATFGFAIPNHARPDRVALGAWPNTGLQPGARGGDTLWDVPVFSMHSPGSGMNGDSAVTIYWYPKTLLPGESRNLGYSYGLGTISGQEGGGELALTAGGTLTPGGAFTLTAYVSAHTNQDKLRLTIPPGFTLVEGDMEVPLRSSENRYAITWKVKAPDREMDADFTAQTTRNIKQGIKIRIRKQVTGGIFG